MELDGTVLGKFGVPGKEQGQFSTVHGIDCRVDNEILVSEIVEWRFQKFILQPHRRSRGQEMTTSRFAATVIFAGSLLAGSLFAQQKELSFDSAGDFLKLPDDIHLGEVAGVATTSRGNLLVYFRVAAPTPRLAQRASTSTAARV